MSDKKALENLVEKLMVEKKLYNEKQDNKSPKSLKQSPKTKTSNRKSRRPDISAQNSMTMWLRSGSCSDNSKSPNLNKSANVSTTKTKVDKNQTSARKKSNQNSKDTERNSNSTPKKKTKFQRSKSFDKYGVVLPSFEDVLAEAKECETYNKSIELLVKNTDNDISNYTFPIKFDSNNIETQLSDIEQNCKHLELDKIEDAFNKHIEILTNIKNGKEECKRHKQYNNFDFDLKGSPSMLVFNQTQKTKMLDLIHSQFEIDGESRNYFFQVLLPELCYLIFMDVYNMDRKSAEEYLDNAAGLLSVHV